ncbi:reverse transcriptase zinc-binding domain-containing protein [Artemisia annua]|uniref:Reverse transcriptase zinc-binding domain-containing protein n=1 Tax=Artemisia annua TaxID=35608 RepID=A0A2U1NBK8_ARTAN|nr:reverse transcriptase zinc-binding domain-containing protein [Artemisia annua]
MLSEWNEALMIKNLWNIADGKETLWVKWANLLELMAKVRYNIVKNIGNGKKTNMWYDQWSRFGVLKDTISTRSIHNAKLSESMSVNEMISNNQWRWPHEWYDQYLMLSNLTVPQLDNKEDITYWKKNNGSLCEFSSKVAWEHISQQESMVRWNKVVWFSQCNPRMAFILWMAVKERLQTQDRIMK